MTGQPGTLHHYLTHTFGPIKFAECDQVYYKHVYIALWKLLLQRFCQPQ